MIDAQPAEGQSAKRQAEVSKCHVWVAANPALSEVVLRNCPFESVRAVSRELTCGMNLALIEGLLAGLGVGKVRARFAPRAGMCCVAVESDPRRK